MSVSCTSVISGRLNSFDCVLCLGIFFSPKRLNTTLGKREKQLGAGHFYDNLTAIVKRSALTGYSASGVFAVLGSAGRYDFNVNVTMTEAPRDAVMNASCADSML